MACKFVLRFNNFIKLTTVLLEDNPERNPEHVNKVITSASLS
jgi:hypothetical protein